MLMELSTWLERFMEALMNDVTLPPADGELLTTQPEVDQGPGAGDNLGFLNIRYPELRSSLDCQTPVDFDDLLEAER